MARRIFLPVVLLFASISPACGLQSLFGSRRQFVATISTAAGTLVSPEPSLSETDSSLSSKLLSIIPEMKSGAPATNATVSDEKAFEIETFVSRLEETSQQRDNVISPILSSGEWRLVYSNAPEIVGLAKGLPLGFRLGPTYQPLKTEQGWFENTARVTNVLAGLRTIVVGTIVPSPKGDVNAAGIINDKNNRVFVNFEAIVFELDELFGSPLQKPIRKTIAPRTPEPGSPLPANDQTYLDERVRIVRGGDGSLFVFCKDARDFLPLSASARRELLAPVTSSFSTPVGEDLERARPNEVPAEIEYLFRDQN
uniref:Plastid lipid-associated protein/fibrillin conserved domain-containing protein n=1 Tax=Pseudo-nitzschia delicatissima TaxID=44447 RepID=A0A7S0Y7P6_9STRA|mmetsp:Transcript_2339/g.4935  ORF Transcript_2339/g.4935 Transcript_2339/m.4935 type:complete len:311 (+) Transcript_2339:120-1052(+)